MPAEHIYHWMTFVVTEAFNPYREWLGLDTDARILNHYQLLDLPEFEEDTAKIHSAAERALVGVRSHRPGAQAAAWAKLLDTLAEAKTCLTDPARKSAYDASLRRGARQSSAPTDAPGKKGPTDNGSLIEDKEQPGTPEVALVNQSPDLFPPGMAPTAHSKPAKTKPTVPPAQTPSRSGARRARNGVGCESPAKIGRRRKLNSSRQTQTPPSPNSSGSVHHSVCHSCGTRIRPHRTRQVWGTCPKPWHPPPRTHTSHRRADSHNRCCR